MILPLYQPAEPCLLMGAALRMATGLGLRKESAESHQLTSPAKTASIDPKRRVWWSLLCMDTWEGMALGRASMGRFGPNVTVKPSNCRNKVSLNDLDTTIFRLV